MTDLSENSMVVKLVLVLPHDGPTVEEVMQVLAQVGIECQPGYTPLHIHERATPHMLPVTEAVEKRVVCIPVDTEFKNTASLLRLSHIWRKRATCEASNVAATISQFHPEMAAERARRAS